MKVRMITIAETAVVALLTCVLFGQPAWAEDERIEVTALLGSKAMIVVDGARHVLSVGDSTETGITLLSIEEDGVRLRVGGEEDFYPLGSTQVSTRYSRPQKLQERVYRDSSGMYRSAGSINGQMVSFLVDTGASAIAMSANEARRLGIDYLVTGRPMAVNTASGTARAWAVTLDRVTLGKIELRNIPAAVVDGSGPQDVLLGMSFLERLNVQHQGEVMVLEMKF